MSSDDVISVPGDAEGVYLVPLSSVVYFSPKEGT